MRNTLRKEEGAVIVVAVFIVMALVVIGSLAVMFTNIELDISRNDRMLKEAFFAADAGDPIATDILKHMILNEGIDYSDPKYMEYMDAGIYFDNYSFINEVRNYYEEDEDYNDKDIDTPDNMPDVTATVGDSTLTMDVDWRLRKAGAGGSLLFAMGYEGIGADRSHGGVKIYYDIDSKGLAAKNTGAEIGVVYLYQ